MKKSAKAKAKPKQVKPSKPQTPEGKLSDVVARMNTIVEGNDAGYHLR